MKVIVRSVIDTLTGKVESMDTIDYTGPVAECRPGGAARAGARAARGFRNARTAGQRRQAEAAARGEAARIARGPRGQRRLQQFTAAARRGLGRQAVAGQRITVTERGTRVTRQARARGTRR